MSLEQWKNVDIFNPHVQWQNDLALRLVDTCETIVGRRGETGIDRFDYEFQGKFYLEDRGYYKDNVVIISQNNKYRENYSTKIENWDDGITVELVSSKKVVLSATKSRVRYGDPVSYGFTSSTNLIKSCNLSVFLIGSWLDHIESLRLMDEQYLKKQKEQQDKREEEYRRKNFGRID